MKENVLDAAMEYVTRRDYSQAESLLMQGLKEDLRKGDNENAAAYFRILGEVAVCKNDLSNALRYFKKAERLCPDDLQNKITLAYFYFLNLRDKHKALRKAEQVLKLDAKMGFPTHQAYQIKGLAYFDEGAYEKSIEMLRKSSEVKPFGLLLALGFELTLVRKLIESKMGTDVCRSYLEKALVIARKGKLDTKAINELLTASRKSTVPKLTKGHL